MSYCRFGSGDVYMFACADGGITCCACHIVPAKFSVHIGTGQHEFFKLMKKSAWKKTLRKAPKPFLAKIQPRKIGRLHYFDPMFDSAQAALNHLALHRSLGDTVPEYAFDRLKKEIDDGDLPYRRTFRQKHRLVQDLTKFRSNPTRRTRRAKAI